MHLSQWWDLQSQRLLGTCVDILMTLMLSCFNATKNQRFNILMWQKQIWLTVSSMLALSCMCSLLLMLSGLQVCIYDDSCFPGRMHLMQHIYINTCSRTSCSSSLHVLFFYFNLFNASKTVWKWQYCSSKRRKKGHKNTKLNYNTSI